MFRAGGVGVAGVAGAAPAEAIVVHGIAFEGRGADEAAILTRKVLLLSKIFVILTVVEAFQDIVLGNTSTFGWLLISLAMPYCGYYGAKNKDRNLLCMFYSINLVLSVMYILWILLMLMILSMVDSANKTCDDCHALTTECQDSLNAEYRNCASRGIECGPPVVVQASGNWEHELEEDEGQDLEHGNYHQQQSQRSACDAWADLKNDRHSVYMQMITCVCQIILACAAFTHGRRLAAHSYFLGVDPGGPMRRAQQPPPVRASRAGQAVRAGPVLKATVVQPVSFEPESVLAPGEVMAGVVRVQCNPVSGSHTPTPQAPIVMATPLATRHMDDDI